MFVSKDIQIIADDAFDALQTGAEDLYNAFGTTQNFANLLESFESVNPQGALANRMYFPIQFSYDMFNKILRGYWFYLGLPRAILVETVKLSENITGTITSAAFVILNFGLNFKNAIATLEFVSTNSDELSKYLVYYDK